MTHTEPQKLTIKWLTKDKVAIDAIRRRFNIPNYTTINGWSPAEIAPEDMKLFEECAHRGFFGFLPYKWCKNGGTFSFISR